MWSFQIQMRFRHTQSNVFTSLGDRKQFHLDNMVVFLYIIDVLPLEDVIS